MPHWTGRVNIPSGAAKRDLSGHLCDERHLFSLFVKQNMGEEFRSRSPRRFYVLPSWSTNFRRLGKLLTSTFRLLRRLDNSYFHHWALFHRLLIPLGNMLILSC
ncbi:hypothetical protein TWF102_006876 [Orbilia oligospora]|uniref:Uncharacterized protein n=1 Tax=Orbilia oligospora TaxID=2813651 RepID=A0A7C8J891_ORBOL|nr:hypothetical protein TWF102_006876 [Orbilia oligospora]